MNRKFATFQRMHRQRSGGVLSSLSPSGVIQVGFSITHVGLMGGGGGHCSCSLQIRNRKEREIHSKELSSKNYLLPWQPLA